MGQGTEAKPGAAQEIVHKGDKHPVNACTNEDRPRWDRVRDECQAAAKSNRDALCDDVLVSTAAWFGRLRFVYAKYRNMMKQHRRPGELLTIQCFFVVVLFCLTVGGGLSSSSLDVAHFFDA